MWTVIIIGTILGITTFTDLAMGTTTAEIIMVARLIAVHRIAGLPTVARRTGVRLMAARLMAARLMAARLMAARLMAARLMAARRAAGEEAISEGGFTSAPASGGRLPSRSRGC
jgi:hypothetical protein